jgi:hypothetical protein
MFPLRYGLIISMLFRTNSCFNREQTCTSSSHKATAQIGTNVRFRVFNAGLLAGSPFVS